MALMNSGKGLRHWKHQRLTAVMLILAAVFFLSATFIGHRASYSEIVVWLRKPYVAAMAIVSLGALFYHSFLGLKMIAEDYVHHKHLRQAMSFILFVLHAFFITLGTVILILI